MTLKDRENALIAADEMAANSDEGLGTGGHVTHTKHELTVSDWNAGPCKMNSLYEHGPYVDAATS